MVDSTDEDGCCCVGGRDNDDFQATLEFAEGYAAGLVEAQTGGAAAAVEM